MAEPICYFQTFSDDLVAFPERGGVFVHDAASGWAFHPSGSLVWDAYHQEVFRNHRAKTLTLEQIAARGISPPASRDDRPAMTWEQNFSSAVPVERVPDAVLARLQHGAVPVHLVTFEDGYETSFGDGRYIYPAAAFWDSADADRDLEARNREAEAPERAPDPAKAAWYRYARKDVELSLDASRARVVARLDLREYEHCSVGTVIELLSRPPR